MKLFRKVKVATVALCVGVTFAAVWAGCDNPLRRPAGGTDGPQNWPYRQLTRHLSANAPGTAAVTVSLPHRPDPTDDPLVWVFREAHNAPKLPPDYELRFSAPPDFSGKAPYGVTGTAQFVADGKRRINGIPGYTRLTAASRSAP